MLDMRRDVHTGSLQENQQINIGRQKRGQPMTQYTQFNCFVIFFYDSLPGMEWSNLMEIYIVSSLISQESMVLRTLCCMCEGRRR